MKPRLTHYWLLSLISTLSVGAGTSNASLVAHFPLDTDANDASGNGHNGVVVGTGVTFGSTGAIGATGSSADFAGSGHIDVPWSAATNSGSFSVSLWARPDAAGGGSFRSPITNRDDVAPGGAFRHGWIIYNNNVGNWSVWNGGGLGATGGWNVGDAGPVAVGSWVHLAITYDGTSNSRTFYIDGVAVPTAAPVDFSPNNGNLADGFTHDNEDLHIGGGGDTGTSFRFDGLIDDVGLWNTALTPGQVAGVFANGVPEPSSFLFGALGACGFLLRRRRA